MKEFGDQNYSELLNLMMDGELPEAQEAELFAELSNSDELKNELRELLAMRQSVRNDTEAYTPPSTSRENVFAALGITRNPVQPAATTAGSAGGTMILSALKKIWLPAASAIIATVFTTLVVSDVYENKIDEIKSNIPIVESRQFDENAVPKPEMKINISKSAQGISASDYNIDREPVQAKPGNIFDSQPGIAEQTEGSITEDAGKAQLPRAISSYGSLPLNSAFSSNIMSGNSSTPAMVSNVSSGNGLLSRLKNFTNERNTHFTVSGLDNIQQLKQSDRNPTNPAKLGFSVCGLIDLPFDNNFKAGIAVGREHFIYQYVELDGNETLVKNNKYSFWFGMTARYEFADLYEFPVYPAIQLTAGTALDHGLLVKCSPAVNCYLTDNFGILLGLDASYTNQKYNFGQQTDHWKLGLKTGLIYKF